MAATAFPGPQTQVRTRLILLREGQPGATQWVSRWGNDLGPLKAQATNFLMDAAEGIANYSMSLVGQPAHHPFQGEI